MKLFRYFIVMFLSSFFVLQSCQAPNNTTINSNFTTKGLYDNYSNERLLEYQRHYEKSVYKTYLLTSGLYSDTCLVSKETSDYNYSNYDAFGGSIVFSFVNNQWVFIFFDKEYFLPASGGSFSATDEITKEGSYQKYNFDISFIITNNIAKLTVTGNNYLHLNNGIGPYGVGFYEGVNPVCPAPDGAWLEYIAFHNIYNDSINFSTDIVLPTPSPTPTSTATPTSTPTPQPTPTITLTPPPSPNPPPGGAGNNSDKPNMDPVYPPKGKPENCMSSTTADGKPTATNRWGDNPYTVVSIYDFDDRPGKANLNIVLRPNSTNGGESNLDNLKVQVKVTVNGSNNNLLITEGDSNSPIYDHEFKNERTNIITFEAQVSSDDINFKNNLGEIPTMEQVANREENSFKNQILSDLAKNTKNSEKNSNPMNGATVSEIDKNGQALSFSDRLLAHSCCIYKGNRKVNIPVLAVKLNDTYNSMSIGDSKELTISGLPNGKTIKLNMTKKDPKSGSNWDISCPLNK